MYGTNRSKTVQSEYSPSFKGTPVCGIASHAETDATVNNE